MSLGMILHKGFVFLDGGGVVYIQKLHRLSSFLFGLGVLCICILKYSISYFRPFVHTPAKIPGKVACVLFFADARFFVGKNQLIQIALGPLGGGAPQFFVLFHLCFLLSLSKLSTG
jgi:hypothetical protein